MKHWTEGRMKLQMVALGMAAVLLVVTMVPDGKPSIIAIVCAVSALISWVAKRLSLYAELQDQEDQS